jgi:hypothetical protein
VVFVIQPTIVTWILIVFGFVTCGPLFYAQGIMILRPQSRAAKDLVVGKDMDWRDRTHFTSSVGGAFADWIVVAPLLVTGTIGVLLGTVWGYLLYAASGAIMLYINVILWFQEKEYVYPVTGPLAYYTYYWGDFMYWGTAAVMYALPGSMGSIFNRGDGTGNVN